jgi:hypothetical protein
MNHPRQRETEMTSLGPTGAADLRLEADDIWPFLSPASRPDPAAVAVLAALARLPLSEEAWRQVGYVARRLLLAGDAFADVLRKSLCRWLDGWPDPSDRVGLDAFKLAHHGSDKNLTPQLMEVISCPTYLISTNGAGNARHPDVETLSMIRSGHDSVASEKPTVRFNYVEPHADLFRIIPGIETVSGEDATLTWGGPSEWAAREEES